MVYTLDSIKKFHQVYYNTRIYNRVTDPAGWASWEQASVDRHLQAKKQVVAIRQQAKKTMAQI